MQLRKELIIKYDQVIAYDRKQIEASINKCKELRDKALISFLYLSAARIEEVVKFKVYDKFNQKYEWVGQPIMLNQFEKLKDGYRVLRVRILKLKRKKLQTRTISIINRPIEKTFYDILVSYLNSLGDNPDTKLWDFSRQRAHQILQKVGLFPHLLRHSRVTHLVLDYNFDIPRLMMATGWSRTDTAAHYTHIKQVDVEERLRNG